MMTNREMKSAGTFRKLWVGENAALQAHLLRLDPESRRMRFGSPVTDYFIEHYAQNALGNHSVVHGYFVDGILRGVAELRGFRGLDAGEAEAAFSVEKDFQNGGIGTELFGRTVLAAQNRGIGKLFVNFLSQNQRMQAIARKFEAVLTFDSDEVTGKISTPHANPMSVFKEAVADGHDLTSRLLDAQATLLKTA